eukprot:gnl/TRDRNA2_/TRDRNA2_146062_c0_seq1.p1 gnl/TRDRNA2_/TRDRNA2_146062_c0~~gnl/TRDRNA2_/TRDRNA2_146062_c0_seq1.p1  ORF type:complete len:168 (-),score=36.76 gnl/TRDRNA2_/TRDRNA2_146062_c0_seq1:3-455(-)
MDAEKDEAEAKALLIDFQWTGVGFGMADVAMHLSHSVACEALRDGGEERLIHFYYTVLMEALGGRGAEYTYEVALHHYNLAVLDYARIVLSYFFAGATPEAFAARADKPNVGLVYRNVEASLLFVKRVDDCLQRVECERAASVEHRGTHP